MVVRYDVRLAAVETPTASPVEADPPWLEEKWRHVETEFNLAMGGRREGWLAAIRAVLRFAAAQPARALDEQRNEAPAPKLRGHISAESAAASAVHALGDDLNKVTFGAIVNAAVTAYRQWENENP